MRYMLVGGDVDECDMTIQSDFLGKVVETKFRKRSDEAGLSLHYASGRVLFRRRYNLCHFRSGGEEKREQRHPFQRP
jgi:hypothetical protein